jgi:hypothetical protein
MGSGIGIRSRSRYSWFIFIRLDGDSSKASSPFLKKRTKKLLMAIAEFCCEVVAC